MNPNDEQPNEQAYAMHLLSEIHDSQLDTLLQSVATSEFADLLTTGSSVVKSAKSVSWSLITSATELGMDLAELGQHLRLSSEILHKLDLRLLRVSTLPERLFDMLADSLIVPVEHIRAYFALPPAIPAGIRFHAASGEPSVVLESFEDALLDEDDISDDDRAYWLGDRC